MLQLFLRASLALPALESLRAFINKTSSISLLQFKPLSINTWMWTYLQRHISIHVGLDISQLLRDAKIAYVVFTHWIRVKTASLAVLTQKWHFTLLYIRDFERQRHFGLFVVANYSFKHGRFFLICALITTLTTHLSWVFDTLIWIVIS